MNHQDILTACHHRFRFLLEELSDTSSDELKKNRLIEEFKNEIDIYCYVSSSFLTDSTNGKIDAQYRLLSENGQDIKRHISELNPSSNDHVNWNLRIMRLKEDVETLLFQYEKTMDFSTMAT